MTTLKEKLQTIIKTAMKGGDKERLLYARNLHAAIRKKEVDDRVDLDDAGVIDIAAALVKQRNDSIAAAKAANRADILAKEEAELAFLQEMLPAALSEAELETMIKAAIAEAGATSAKDMGKVMKVVSPQTKGRADGKVVSELVKKLLSS
ncbi:MAG: GatB/YqeY domain-containing protein [Planctomycetota bacterium]